MRKIAPVVFCALAFLASVPALALEPKQCLPMAEMNAELKASGQRTIIIGNRTALKSAPERKSGIAADQWVNTFTSNADGSLGFNLEGDKPMGRPSQTVCVRGKFTHIELFDARKSGTPAKAKRGGQFDMSLQKNEAMGTRPMMQADSFVTLPDGTMRLGNGMTLFGNQKIKSAYLVVNYPDATAADMFTMTETDYTPTGIARIEAKSK